MEEAQEGGVSNKCISISLTHFSIHSYFFFFLFFFNDSRVYISHTPFHSAQCRKCLVSCSYTLSRSFYVEYTFNLYIIAYLKINLSLIFVALLMIRWWSMCVHVNIVYMYKHIRVSLIHCPWWIW